MLWTICAVNDIPVAKICHSVPLQAKDQHKWTLIAIATYQDDLCQKSVDSIILVILVVRSSSLLLAVLDCFESSDG